MTSRDCRNETFPFHEHDKREKKTVTSFPLAGIKVALDSEPGRMDT